MIESTYSVSSFEGLVSSKRRLHLPPKSRARPKFKAIDLAWPTCRYPFGSGGKRVCTRPPYLLVFRSSKMMSRIKLDGVVVGSLMIFFPRATPRPTGLSRARFDAGTFRGQERRAFQTA